MAQFKNAVFSFSLFNLLFVLASYVTGTSGSENATVVVLIGDRIQRFELNLFQTNESFTFQLDSQQDFYCSSQLNCEPRLSVSLLKMACNVETDSRLRIRSLDEDVVANICTNYTYMYTTMSDSTHKNMHQFKFVKNGVTISTVGSWGVYANASILISIHYEMDYCPDRVFFDCANVCKNVGDNHDHKPTRSVCIPWDWQCDKRPNCGICEDADESEDICDWDWSNSLGFHYSNFFVLLLDVICFGLIPFVVIIVVLRFALRAIQIQRLEVRRPSDNSVPYVPRRKSEDPPPSYGEVVVDVATVEETTVAPSTPTSSPDNNNNLRRNP